MEPCRVLLADPPWSFGDALPGAGRGASKHYACMTTEEIIDVERPPIASDCLLALWRVAAMQQEALDVAEGWGFTVKAELVWNKLTKNGKRWFGMGHYVRAEHEVCLLATRGRVKVADRSIRSVFDAVAREHSRKPDELYNILERLVPDGPYGEVFARHRREGWAQYGDQLV